MVFNEKNQIMSMNQVVEITGLSKSTIKRLVKRNEFPPCIRISERRIGWKASDINNWIQAREINRMRGYDEPGC